MKSEKRLGQIVSTAISGNDILSSALYVSGIAIIFAGIYAPLVLLFIGIVLFFYRTVYREVVEALPVNGGAYNALLNGTSKTIAATAGVMTILSYTATAVISAATAVEYLFLFLGNYFPKIHFGSYVIPTVIVILLLFSILVITGLRDSAKVALGIFGFHIVTLVVFLAVGIFFIATHGFGTLQVNAHQTGALITLHGGLPETLFLAFSASLLGVSGFESSANFVEEQKKGVFKHTLRNMTIGIIIFNPAIAFVVLNVLHISFIPSVQDSVLAVTALRMGGLLLTALISIDAFFVLCGAVLTSFIGVSGLVNRMTLDECLPHFLAKENSKNAHPRIIITFFLLCTSILIMTKADLLSLAGVYTISFLSVMSLFAFGNLILRQTRRDLKRPYKAPFLFVIFAFAATASGIIGNILIDQRNVVYFLTYFIPASLLVISLIYKRDIIYSMTKFTKHIPPVHDILLRKYNEVINRNYYVFINHVDKLYEILAYINRNESGGNITLIHCKEERKENTGEILKGLIQSLNTAGAFKTFNIKVKYIDEVFGPEVINNFALTHHIMHNRIFIGSIHDFHKFDYDELGGVRIIT